jgi:hypothetical protein
VVLLFNDLETDSRVRYISNDAVSANGNHTPSVQMEGCSPDSNTIARKPKPCCWEHGCDGRQFSTWSNLIRHQREKSEQARKFSCPECGAEFTRVTARNGHVQRQKCKQNLAGVQQDRKLLPAQYCPR